MDEIAGISMGLDVFPRRRWFEWNADPVEIVLAHPVRRAFAVLVFYLLLFCCLPFLACRLGLLPWCQSPRLYAFQVYGALWAGWATASTKLATAAVRRVIQREILPYLSEETAAEIEKTLQSFNRRRTLSASILIGGFAATLAGVLIYVDLDGGVPKPEIVFWSLGWFLLFTTSANVVINGQFYGAFSQHAICEAGRLFGPDPSRSSLIRSLSSLGQIMLVFWFGIAFSIALIVPVAMGDWNKLLTSHWGELPWRALEVYQSLRPLGPFVGIYLAATGIFSIGLGTVVFLAHESGIRRAVNAAINITLRPIEAAFTELVAQGGTLSENDRKQLAELSALHAAIANSGSYRSAIISFVSLALPLILPVVTAIAGLIGKGKG